MKQEIQKFYNWPSELDGCEVNINMSWLESKYELAIGSINDIFSNHFGLKEYETHLLKKFTEHAPSIHSEEYLNVSDILIDQPKYSFDKNKYLDDYCSSIVKAFLYAKVYLANKKYDQCLDALLTIQHLRGCFLGISRTPIDAELLDNKVKAKAIGRNGGLSNSSKYTPLRSAGNGES
jgi:hypothetical protein